MRARRTIGRVPPLLCLLILTSSFHVGQSIWSLSVPHQVYIVGSVGHFCTGIQGLSPSQRKQCADPRNRGIMATIRHGAQLAIKECQYQFQFRRWNCSVPAKDSNSLFRHITDKGTREAAFTYAISSAGVVHSIARACVEGNLSLCGCSRERRPEELERAYQWGGCGDNIEYGSRFTKQFMNSGEDDTKVKIETKEQEKTLMNLHNIEAGIRVVKGTSEFRCKCHGVSQSCQMKTCWRELNTLRNISYHLRDKYDHAVRVKLDRRIGSLKRYDGGNTKGNIVYLNNSPDYCLESREHETPGTFGRECKIDSSQYEECDYLCCSRGFRRVRVIVKKRCRCKFHWCCYVKCKECVFTLKKNVCV